MNYNGRSKMEDGRREWLNVCMPDCFNSFIQSCIQSFIIVLFLISVAFAQFNLPSYEVVELDNGLTVYIMEKKDVPLISFSAVFEGGVIKDGSASGIASFTAEAMRFGTTNYSKSQIDSLFNFYGSNVSTYANADYSGLYTQFMKENTETLLSVVREIVLSPTFPDEEIQKRKQRWIAELD